MKKEHPGVPGGGASGQRRKWQVGCDVDRLISGLRPSSLSAFVLLITVYLIISGLPAIREVGLTDFLFGTRWASTDKTDPAYGVLPFILTSIYGSRRAIRHRGAHRLPHRLSFSPRLAPPRWPPSSVRQWICWRASPRWSTAWWA